jgi:methionine synthase II (cobalamin-independent)
MYEISSDESIKQAERKAIEWAVAKQLELDIRPICSGEYNRHIFYGGFFEKLEGMTPIPHLPIIDAFRTDFPTTTKLAEIGAKTRAAVVRKPMGRKIRRQRLRKHDKSSKPA